MTGSDFKTCTKCGEAKPLPEGFYFEKGKPRGCCKECHRAVLRARTPEQVRAINAKSRAKYREKNRERERQRRIENGDEMNATRRANRLADPEKYRERSRARWERLADSINAERRAAWPTKKDEENAKRRAQRASDPSIAEAERRYREHNRERINATARAYYAKHPEKWEPARRAREARKAGIEHQPYTRREIFERDGGVCCGCGKELAYAPREFQIDHIVPISLGGPDIPANVQLMCPTCNRRKWAKLEGQIHLPV